MIAVESEFLLVPNNHQPRTATTNKQKTAIADAMIATLPTLFYCTCNPAGHKPAELMAEPAAAKATTTTTPTTTGTTCSWSNYAEVIVDLKKPLGIHFSENLVAKSVEDRC